MDPSKVSSALRMGFLVVVFVLVPAQSALATVTVSRAEMAGSELRLEGQAAATRTITVDGSALGTSDSGGRFQIRRTFSAPADCTIDVNDGSARAATATLSGCTVTSPPPPMNTGPPAPPPIAPADGASVTVPFTISWAAVSDPSGIAGYNWQVSTTPAFSSLVLQDSTSGTATQATVGGLVPGTYYWRVQAASNAFVQGAWSAARSVVVAGSGSTSPGTPVFDPLKFGTAYHPMESFPISWSAVPGAASYTVEVSKSASFPAPPDIKFDNIPNPSYGLTFHRTLIGTWFVRVYAVDANGVRGVPSNARTFTIDFNAPLGPAPTLASPANGAVVKLPILVDWNDVPNPQDSGYEIQVSNNASFTAIENPLPGRTTSDVLYTSLSPGPKWWRVRHAGGDASATTAAVTAWSEVRTFTVEASPATISSVSLTRNAAYSGEEIVGTVQLSAVAPAGGANVQLSSSDPAAVPVPASLNIPAGVAIADFRFVFGQVTAATPATITASLGSSSATYSLTVNPPGLKSVETLPPTITGGSPGVLWVNLNGAAPPGGLTVSLGSSSPLARPPATVTVPAGFAGSGFDVPTSEVSADTSMTLSGTYNGFTSTAPLTLRPGLPPDSLTLSPASVTGGTSSEGRVGLAAAADRDARINLTSSNPAVASVPPYVQISQFGAASLFTVTTTAVTSPTVVTISATAAGVTKTATLTVNAQPPPPPPGPLAAPTLLSPGADARIGPNVAITFDWSDVPNAAGYRFQVSSSSTFTSAQVDQNVTASQYASAFAATGSRWWRVQAINSAGGAGTWSPGRAFRIK